MEHYYIALLVFLGLLAVFDLFVGVSNDAVNFLNSALGCRIASFKTTMFVASIGVMLGATFSSGMMEIARSGVFNPQMFTFNEIMVIFFAVMVTDIILLDTFNSLGLPTSTTVSIVFELLGSALAAAAFTLLADGAWDRETAVYRISGVLTVISGWFITALCASTMAAVVCWLTLWGEGIVALIFAVGSVFLLVRSNLKAKLDTVDMRADLDTRYDAHKMQQLVEERTEVNFEKTVAVFGELVDKFLADKESDLRQIKTDSNELFDKMSADRGLYYRMANSSFKPTNKDFDARYCYYRISTNMREVGRSLQSLAKLATDHVANRHRIYQGELKNELQNLAQYLKQISTGEGGKLNLRNVMLHADEASNRIDALQAELLRRIPDDKLSVRGCELYLNFLVFAREFINRCSIVAVLSGQLDEIAQRQQ